MTGEPEKGVELEKVRTQELLDDKCAAEVNDMELHIEAPGMSLRLRAKRLRLRLAVVALGLLSLLGWALLGG